MNMYMALSLLVAVMIVFVGVAGLVWSTHSRLGMLDSRCDSAASDVDVQLKHRHGLVSSLVETVRGFTAHERGVIDAVLNSRAQAMRAFTPDASVNAEQVLSLNIGKLMATAEQYPKLMADEHFRNLAREIADAENKITAARRFMNTTIKEYNAVLRQFPANKLAARMGLAQRGFFDLGIERAFIDDAPALKL